MCDQLCQQTPKEAQCDIGAWSCKHMMQAVKLQVGISEPDRHVEHSLPRLQGA